MYRTYFFLFIVAVASACGNSNSKNSQTEAKDTTMASAPAKNTEPVTENENGSKVSFKVNDTVANTDKKAGDNEDDIGIYTETIKHLTLSLMGDVPSRPHRGSLDINIHDFKFEPASYSITNGNNAAYSRYGTINAGESVVYLADEHKKETQLSLTITKIVKDPSSFNGRDWLATGTFSTKLQNRDDILYKKKPIEEVTLTEGTFENVRIAGGPK